jgi:menaquinone-specific isochorismate synthase
MKAIKDVKNSPPVAELSCPPPWRAWDALAQKFSPAFLWRGRGEADVFLALGAHRTFSTLDEARNTLRGSGQGRAFCAVAFDPETDVSGPWEGFAKRLCVLPEVLVRWRDGQATIQAMADGNGKEVAEMLRTPPPLAMPPAVDGSHSFSWQDWVIAVHAIRAGIKAGNVSKVVLARDSIREMSSRVHPGFVLEQLAASAVDCYLFAHGINEANFLSATPERLFRLEGDTLETESLAGTRARGKDMDEDVRLARELLASGKDNAEQKIVTQFLVEGLAPLCTSVTADPEPHLRKLAHVQHLHTRVEGRLKPDVPLDEILRALHPTPAVCGTPRSKARRMIADLERMPRGLYAGAIGWIEAESAEFAVAIRSALLRDRFAHVFAGAGIVEQSDARAEWRETALKMKPMLTALGCTTP